MKYRIVITVLSSLAVLSCASHSGKFPGSDARVTIENSAPSDSNTAVSPKPYWIDIPSNSKSPIRWPSPAA